MRKVELSLQERRRGRKSSFWQKGDIGIRKNLFKGALGFPNLLHEFRLNELRHFPSHFHQLCQCHELEAISGIYPDILIPHFLSLGRISTHTTHAHSRYELREIRNLQMAVIQIVHQKVGINSNLVALIIETTFYHHLTPDIASRKQWQPTTSHLPASILTTSPFSHHLIGFLLIHEDTIRIEEIATRLLHLLHNVRYRILGKHKVIRMAESNHKTYYNFSLIKRYKSAALPKEQVL